MSFSKSRAGHDLVTFKGWPAGRRIITGTRYRLDNPKIVEMQIGRPGLRAAARESARFGLWLVVAIDVADYLLRDNATLGYLLASLTVDLPSVVLASAIDFSAGSFLSATSIGSLATIGTFACGPFVIALFVGIVAGYTLYRLDDRFGLTEKLGPNNSQPNRSPGHPGRFRGPRGVGHDGARRGLIGISR